MEEKNTDNILSNLNKYELYKILRKAIKIGNLKLFKDVLNSYKITCYRELCYFINYAYKNGRYSILLELERYNV